MTLSRDFFLTPGQTNVVYLDFEGALATWTGVMEVSRNGTTYSSLGSVAYSTDRATVVVNSADSTFSGFYRITATKPGGSTEVTHKGKVRQTYVPAVSSGDGLSQDDADALYAPLTSALSAKEYGATGDGSTDDTSALQAWLNAAATLGAIAFLPAGKYVTGTLNIPNGVNIKGVARGGFGVTVPDSRVSRLFLKSSTNGHLLSGALGVAHVRLKDLYLDGNKAGNSSGSCVHIANATGDGEEAQWLIDGCYITNGAGANVYVGTQRRAVKISKTVSKNSASHGMHVAGSDSGIETCIIGDNTLDGIFSQTNVIRIFANDIFKNRNGINIEQNSTNLAIFANGIDRNQNAGIYIANNVADLNISNNIFHSNSQSTNGGHPHIRLTSTTGRIIITNNTFAGLDAALTNKIGYAINSDAGCSAFVAFNTFVPGSATTATMANSDTKMLTDIGQDRAYQPQAPALVCTFDPRLASGTAAMGSNNQIRAGRLIIPRTGTLEDVCLWFTASSGNICVSIFDTASGTRTRLWTTGSIACPAAGSWANVGDPGLSVTAGQHLDFSLQVDNTTASYARIAMTAALGDLPTGFHPSPSGGLPKLAWNAVPAFPTPATLTEGSITATSTIPLIIARVV